jgi:hypothetical protein
MSELKPESWNKRRQSYAKAEEVDVYNIRKKGRKPFELQRTFEDAYFILPAQASIPRA